VYSILSSRSRRLLIREVRRRLKEIVIFVAIVAERSNSFKFAELDRIWAWSIYWLGDVTQLSELSRSSFPRELVPSALVNRGCSSASASSRPVAAAAAAAPRALLGRTGRARASVGAETPCGECLVRHLALDSVFLAFSSWRRAAPNKFGYSLGTLSCERINAPRIIQCAHSAAPASSVIGREEGKKQVRSVASFRCWFSSCLSHSRSQLDRDQRSRALHFHVHSARDIWILDHF